jgi:signal recognition particle GTPase
MGNKTDEAKEKAKENLFKQQMDYMTANPTYTMADHVKLYETIAEKAGVTGWKKMLLTDVQKTELAEQLVDLKIGAELTAGECADIASVDGKTKARVAAAVGCEQERVNKFVDSYLQSVKIHGWLQGRKAKNVAIPGNMTEFVHCMMADRQHFQPQKKGQGGGGKKTKGAIRNTMRRM